MDYLRYFCSLRYVLNPMQKYYFAKIVERQETIEILEQPILRLIQRISLMLHLNVEQATYPIVEEIAENWFLIISQQVRSQFINDGPRPQAKFAACTLWHIKLIFLCFLLGRRLLFTKSHLSPLFTQVHFKQT